MYNNSTGMIRRDICTIKKFRNISESKKGKLSIIDDIKDATVDSTAFSAEIFNIFLSQRTSTSPITTIDPLQFHNRSLICAWLVPNEPSGLLSKGN